MGIHPGDQSTFLSDWLSSLHDWSKYFLEGSQLSRYWPLSRVRLSPLGTAATTGLLYQPQMIDDGDCGAIGGMKIGRESRSTWRKPAQEPLRLPQIPHEQTRAAAVGSQRLTAWATARPLLTLILANIRSWSAVISLKWAFISALIRSMITARRLKSVMIISHLGSNLTANNSWSLNNSI
jgi:hypothetical protein